MTGVLVDTCVLLDLIQEDPQWYSWSAEQIEQYSDTAPLFINPVIYSEVSIGFKTIEALNEALPVNYFQRSAIPEEALFLAGKAFMQYKRSGGKRNSILSDFFIGAHAVVNDYTLLTRDLGRFLYYFPSLKLVNPPLQIHESV